VEISQHTIANKPNIWFGDVGTIYRITKEMEHKVALAGLGVKVMFLTMGYVSDTVLRNLELSLPFPGYCDFNLGAVSLRLSFADHGTC
jgi:hypothetical protein